MGKATFLKILDRKGKIHPMFEGTRLEKMNMLYLKNWTWVILLGFAVHFLEQRLEK